MKRFVRFVIGAILYPLMEIIYRGRSHWTMGLVGGLCFIVGGEVDEHAEKKPFWAEMLIITFVITAFEYAAGLMFNKDFKIWDYREQKYNLDGQICLMFFLIWLIFMAPLIKVLDNWLRKVKIS